MSTQTSPIEWTDRTWNPVRGCSVVSPGCVNCYAMKQAHRFSGPGRAYEGLTKSTAAGPQWTGRVVTDPGALLAPLSWRTPARVFVNSMSDLFHEDVPDAFIDQVFAVMGLTPQHTYQVLTKRPQRLRDYCRTLGRHHEVDRVSLAAKALRLDGPGFFWTIGGGGAFLPNVWIGVSAEDQQRADARIPLLLETPAAVRFVSLEPLLGPVSLVSLHNPSRSEFQKQYRYPGDKFDALNGTRWINGQADDFVRCHGLDWVIVGGESGPGARDCRVAWVRSVVEQCRAARVPVFVKQLGARIIDRNDAGFLGDEPDHWPDVIDQEDRVEHDLDGTRDGYQGAPVRVHLHNRKGADPVEWPEDLRVREFPKP